MMADETAQHAALDAPLAAIPLFAGLAPKTLGRIARSVAQREFASGATLFERGQIPDGLYGVLSGRVKLALPAPGRDEKVVSLRGPGQTFGEEAVFLDEPHVLSAQTLTRSKLVHVPKSVLPGCMKSDPQFAARIVWTLGRRVRELVTQVENGAVLSGAQRVADFLLRELDGESAGGAFAITLPARKRVIASQLDLTQEHFSRLLRELSAGGLLAVQGATVTVPDIGRLRAYRDASRPAR